MIANAEVKIPTKVFTSASEIPVARADVSGAPAADKAANARIIPTTVPIRPAKVPIDAIVEITTMFFDNIGNSREVASSSAFWIA